MYTRDRETLSNFAMQTFQGVVQQNPVSKYLHVPNSPPKGLFIYLFLPKW